MNNVRFEQGSPWIVLGYHTLVEPYKRDAVLELEQPADLDFRQDLEPEVEDVRKWRVHVAFSSG